MAGARGAKGQTGRTASAGEGGGESAPPGHPPQGAGWGAWHPAGHSLQSDCPPLDASTACGPQFPLLDNGPWQIAPRKPSHGQGPQCPVGGSESRQKGQVQKLNGAPAPRWPQIPCSPAHRATPAHQPLRQDCQKSPELRLFIGGLPRTPQAPLLPLGWSATALHPTSLPSTSSCFPLVTLQGTQDTVSACAPGNPTLELLMLRPWRPSPHLWANSSPYQIPPPPGGPPGCPFPEPSLPGHFG